MGRCVSGAGTMAKGASYETIATSKQTGVASVGGGGSAAPIDAAGVTGRVGVALGSHRLAAPAVGRDVEIARRGDADMPEIEEDQRDDGQREKRLAQIGHPSMPAGDHAALSCSKIPGAPLRQIKAGTLIPPPFLTQMVAMVPERVKREAGAMPVPPPRL